MGTPAPTVTPAAPCRICPLPRCSWSWCRAAAARSRRRTRLRRSLARRRAGRRLDQLTGPAPDPGAWRACSGQHRRGAEHDRA
jgi:hypothetical protein